MEVTSGVSIQVTEPTHVAEARRRGAELASQLGFDETTRGRVALVITEAGTNLLKHADGGELVVGPAPGAPLRGVQILALDRGGGIPDVAASLRDGYSTAGTAGTGLGALARVSTTLDLYTSADRGTVLAATVYPNGAAAPLEAGVSVPLAGETRCGDGWATWRAGELTSIFVSDGLGHGPDASHATDRAVAAFRQHAERPAADVIRYVYDALKSTRGAAVAVAELDRREGCARYCALGNITGEIVYPDGARQHLVSHNGIAGHAMRRLQEFTCPWPAGSLIVLHSDGVAAQWSLDRYAGLLLHRPDVIAGVLYRDFRRQRDDATVVVARNGMP